MRGDVKSPFARLERESERVRLRLEVGVSGERGALVPVMERLFRLSRSTEEGTAIGLAEEEVG